MVVNNYIFYFALLFSINLTQGQNYLIKFKADIKLYDLTGQNSKNLSNSQKIYLKSINKKNKYLSDALTLNVITNNAEYFLYYDDILLKDKISSSDLKTSKLTISSFPEILHKDDVSYGFSATLDSVLVRANYSDYYEWKIDNQVKQILGYKCYKAIPILKDDLKMPDGTFIPSEVWFTPDLNLKGSPGMFTGLPGLILEYKTSNALISAKSIEETDKKIKIIDLSCYKTYSYNHYNEQIRKYYKKLRNNLK